MLGTSPQMQEVFAVIRKVAPAGAPGAIAWGKRNRKGDGGVGYPSAEFAQRRAIHRDQLQCYPGEPY